MNAADTSIGTSASGVIAREKLSYVVVGATFFVIAGVSAMAIVAAWGDKETILYIFGSLLPLRITSRERTSRRRANVELSRHANA